MRIFLGYPTLSTFVARDIKILSEQHTVIARQYRSLNPLLLAANLAAVIKSKLVVLWFASGAALPLALLARVIGKKLIVIVGGYEAVNLPEINYGAARTRWRRAIVELNLFLAHKVVAVSESSRQSILSELRVPAAKITLIYHGFEDLWTHQAVRERCVITVGALNTSNWLVKGLRDFSLTAEVLPTVQFLHIGKVSVDMERTLDRKLPENVQILGKLSYSRICERLAAAKVYLQLSRHESFGCSVAEAMVCGCIPVVTDAFALPEVVGDTGIILTSREPEVVRDAILTALEMPESEGLRARERILRVFSYEKRRDQLLALVAEVADK